MRLIQESLTIATQDIQPADNHPAYYGPACGNRVFTDSRGPVNLNHSVHCMRSLSGTVRYTVRSLCEFQCSNKDKKVIDL